MIRSRRMLAVAVAVLVLAVVVIAALVIPTLFARSSGDTTDVVDITSEPKATWSYEWAGDSNPDFLDDSPGVARVGETQALVWPVFDLEDYGAAIGGLLGWYEGYDQQYDEGYAAGLEFRAADDAYHNDTFPYTVPPAHAEDFFPEGTYDNDEEFLGFHDGFNDAAQAFGAGANRREKPVDPGYAPVVTLVNVETGEAQWSVDLAEEIDDMDFVIDISAHDITDSTAVAVVVVWEREDANGTSLLTLDRANGKVLSSITTDGSIDVAGFDGDIIVLSGDEASEAFTVGRFAVNRLDDKPRWKAETGDTPYLFVDGDFVMVYGGDAGSIFAGSDGEKAVWGEDASFSDFYQFVGDQLVRIETDDEGGDQSVEGWSVDGTPTWKKPVTAGSIAILDGEIFTTDAYIDPSRLQRVSAADGSVLWEVAYGPPFEAFVGVQGNALLVSRASSIVVIDLGTGAERFTQKVGDFRDVYEGESLYYVPAGDELVAYRYTGEGTVWSLGLDKGQSVTTLGNRLVLVDADTLTLRGLAAK